MSKMWGKVMERVTRQEFIRYTSKYLKNLPIIVTKHGEDDFVVERASKYSEVDGGIKYEGRRSKVKRVLWQKTTKEEFRALADGVYACGCSRVEGKKLCGKHNRS